MIIEISHTELPESWIAFSTPESVKFSAELARELCPQHPLFGLVAQALAKKKGRDDFLFAIEGTDAPYYVVHLTWRKEHSPLWPAATSFASKEDFLHHWQRRLYK